MTSPQQVRPTHPHPEPRAYDEILRTWTWAWWRVPVGFLLFIFGFLVLSVALMVVPAVIVALEGHEDYLKAFEEAVTLERVTPAGMLYVNLTLASAIPATWFVVRFVHNLRPRWLASVRPGIRWRFLWACFGLAFVAVLAQVVAGMVVPMPEADAIGEPNEMTRRLLMLGLVILLTTPLQAIGEEYAFRGYLMQAVGSLVGGITRSKGVVHGFAIVVPALLFALAHGAQNAPLFLDRFVFGVMAAYLVLRTGGLEAGIALHILNNLVAFGIALVYSDIDSALNVGEVSWWQLPLTLTQNGVFLVLVLLVARRMGVESRTRPPVLVSPDAPV